MNWAIIESVFLPEAYIVPGDWEEAMPTHFRLTLPEQDLTDIIAWMANFE